MHSFLAPYRVQIGAPVAHGVSSRQGRRPTNFRGLRPDPPGIFYSVNFFGGEIVSKRYNGFLSLKGVHYGSCLNVDPRDADFSWVLFGTQQQWDVAIVETTRTIGHHFVMTDDRRHRGCSSKAPCSTKSPLRRGVVPPGLGFVTRFRPPLLYLPVSGRIGHLHTCVVPLAVDNKKSGGHQTMSARNWFSETLKKTFRCKDVSMYVWCLLAYPPRSSMTLTNPSSKLRTEAKSVQRKRVR